jgi:signal transduction histidine kinase
MLGAYNFYLRAVATRLQEALKDPDKAHDLRAPLRSIDGFSQAVLEDYQGLLDAQGIKYLQQVRQSAQEMAHLIDDLLSLSRLTRHEIRRDRVDLSRLACAPGGRHHPERCVRQWRRDSAPSGARKSLGQCLEIHR